MSNTDLQQYDGTPSFPATADVGTSADPFLEPTDGPVITAESNLTDEAPVKPALDRTKDLLLGLRGAIVGDFMGAQRRSLKGLDVDGVGGQISVVPAGKIFASGDITTAGGDITAMLGDLLAPSGEVVAQHNIETLSGNLLAILSTAICAVGNPAAERTNQTNHNLQFLATTTGSGGANPPQGTSIKNQLRAINTSKCKAFVEMQSPGVIDSFDGCGIASVVINGMDPHLIEITFADAFDNIHYTVKSSGIRIGPVANYMIPMERVDLRTTTKCFFEVLNFNSGTSLDFSATAISFSLDIDGQQTT